MSEVSNIQSNMNIHIHAMIFCAKGLAKEIKRAEFGERNNGSDLIEKIIVFGYCAIYMSHISTGDLEEIGENVLGYFKTGLYDTNKTTGTTRNEKSSFDVRAWIYTPDTHNDAGHWVYIYTFDNIYDAVECINMLKEIEGELKRLY